MGLLNFLENLLVHKKLFIVSVLMTPLLVLGRVVPEDTTFSGSLAAKVIIASPTAIQSITAVSDTIVSTGTNLEIASDADYVLSSTPSIVAGENGQLLIIHNTSVFTIDLQDDSVLSDSDIFLGGAEAAIKPGSAMTLQYASSIPGWVVISNPNSASAGAEASILGVRNVSGGAISATRCVYITGWNVGQNRATIDLADADDPTKMPCVGLTATSIGNGSNGDIITSGIAGPINTSTASVNVPVWVDTTGNGTLVFIRPTVDDIQQVALVARANASGQLFVSVLERANDSPIVPQTRYCDLLGKSGGQVLIGGTASGDDLTLQSTSDGTLGSIFFGDANGLVYDETNVRLSLGSSDTEMTVGGVTKDHAFSTHTQGGMNAYDIAFHRHSNTGAPTLISARSRGSEASPSAVVDGDVLFEIQGVGYDGTDYEFGAAIQFKVDGSPGDSANDMPGEIVFETTPDGSGTFIERMRIDSVGDTFISGVLKLADGSSGSPSLTATSDTDTGMFWKAADNLTLQVNGLDAIDIIKDSTDTFANVGFGIAASTGVNFPFRVKRDHDTFTAINIQNIQNGASAGARLGLTVGAGAALSGFMIMYPSAHTLGSRAARLSLESRGSTTGVSLTAQTASGDIRFYAGGNDDANEIFRFDVDGAQTFYKELSSTPTAPASGTNKVYFKDDGKFYHLDDADVELEIGSGGGAGGINFISSNPDAESNVTGWVAYADAAGVAPVDCTGGSPTVTITRDDTAADIIRGTASFEITKDAADRQGEGVSFLFATDNFDRGGALEIKFDYRIDDTDYASGDLGVFIHDVTNDKLIAVRNDDDGSLLTPAVNGSGFLGIFTPATDSTSYRLCIHQTTANAALVNVHYDTVSVGPEGTTPGSIIGATTAFTPTWNNLSFGNGTQNWIYQRVGDHLHIHGNITFGSTTSISGSVTMDNPIANTTLTQLSGALSNGIVNLLDSDTSPNNEVGPANISSGAIRPMTFENNNIDATTPFTWATSDRLGIDAWFKIDEWKATHTLSTTQNINQTIIVSASGNPSNPPGSVASPATFNVPTERTDTHGAYNNTTGIFTAPRSGQYDIFVDIEIAGTETANDSLKAQVFIDGVGGDSQTYRLSASGATSTSVHFHWLVDLVANTAVDIRVGTDITTPVYSATTQGNQIKILSRPDFNSWSMSKSIDKHQVRLHTSNGEGSTNNKIRIFSTIVEDIGACIDYATSAADGNSLTVNCRGVYAISYNDQANAASTFGVSLNSSQLTTGIASITSADALIMGTTPGVDLLTTADWTGVLESGDVIRAHTTGTAAGANTALVRFTMTLLNHVSN